MVALLGLLATTYVVGALVTFWLVVLTYPRVDTDDALTAGGWYAVTWPYWLFLEGRAWIRAGRG